MNTWYGAKNYCESKNMTLMNVKDKEKFNAVQSYLKKRSTSETRAWVCSLTFYFGSYFYDLIALFSYRLVRLKYSQMTLNGLLRMVERQKSIRACGTKFQTLRVIKTVQL